MKKICIAPMPGPATEIVFRPGGSKSISNRVLLLDRLAGGGSQLKGLSNAADTYTMRRLLDDQGSRLDAGPAGTCYRFMTAYLAFREGTQLLTGSARMMERPIGPLVDALRQLGARIRYVGREGFPPLEIGPPGDQPASAEVLIDGSASSQFVSALMMIAPGLTHGLRIRLSGTRRSSTYLDMTSSLMKEFGAVIHKRPDGYRINPGKYRPTKIEVEADWSSAAFPIALQAIRRTGTLHIPGLQATSLQGDSVIREIANYWGLRFDFVKNQLRVSTHSPSPTLPLHFDFSHCPDLAPAVIATQAALGLSGKYTGLENLKIKESDRIKALTEDLKKVSVSLHSEYSQAAGEKIKPEQKLLVVQQGKAVVQDHICFTACDDHRIAMSMSLLATRGAICIDDAEVVKKSYPNYWDDLAAAGFAISRPGSES